MSNFNHASKFLLNRVNNEEKAKKDAGGDEELIIKFAWPN